MVLLFTNKKKKGKKSFVTWLSHDSLFFFSRLVEWLGSSLGELRSNTNSITTTSSLRSRELIWDKIWVIN